MNDQGGSMVIFVLLACAFSARLGRHRRREGRPPTPREVVLRMAGIWALGWLWVGLRVLGDWGRHVPWSEAIPAALALLGIGTLPLALVLLAAWLPGVFGRDGRTPKKAAMPDLLD